ncbi:hypothetical protein HY480_04815 [Candidatus Uhrbacteria bacterium]|nr:hypothetical protein [Candidatus Uhrbacteria bacterium]
MAKQITIGITIGVFGLTFLLGAGCRPTPPAPPPAAPPMESPQAAPTVAPDPLADDLDSAIEDLNAIE